jgi:hypothetical protein
VKQQSQFGRFSEGKNMEGDIIPQETESGCDPLDVCGVLNLDVSIETDYESLFD